MGTQMEQIDRFVWVTLATQTAVSDFAIAREDLYKMIGKTANKPNPLAKTRPDGDRGHPQGEPS
jgi:hypothetical protein